MKTNSMVDGEIDLSALKQKKLSVKPDSEGLFHYELSESKKKIKIKVSY